MIVVFGKRVIRYLAKMSSLSSETLKLSSLTVNSDIYDRKLDENWTTHQIGVIDRLNKGKHSNNNVRSKPANKQHDNEEFRRQTEKQRKFENYQRVFYAFVNKYIHVAVKTDRIARAWDLVTELEKKNGFYVSVGRFIFSPFCLCSE